MTTIVLADDHKMLRQGIRTLLEFEPDFTVIGEASNGTEALDLVKRTHPDILVTDITMPPPTGIQLAEEIKRRHYPTKVIVLSMHDNEFCMTEALTVGASAYVLKESGVEDIVKAIREALDGRRFVSSPFILPTAL